ncbi:anti-phage deoxyguanosine triphosphatase [Aliagarivorans taiwanensis]|uniref:anti-phage deoxyguanosine triphosphatase n=1 Tax=Aliagarivorans taiwanensis TaxID=561966 RepID=UPI0003FA6666|nr:anti-phage deoxyguanosine triphosphatase [Aliagarivorans taiwanensis]
MEVLSGQPGAARYSEEQHKRHRDLRSPWQRDRARVLHSAAFRRLQNKTQVLGVGDNDFYRTRLTHSLEVAQIGTGIVSQLRASQPDQQPLLPSQNLIEALCLAHDIGHPPFGHGGEVALNYMMREHGGFEGNAQTLRILTKLEPYTRNFGMNLCRRSLLGVMKYPCLISELEREPKPKPAENFRQLKVGEWSPAKGIYDDDLAVYQWILAPLSESDRALFTSHELRQTGQHRRSRFKSLDCSIMELADDIAYGVHDLEDAVVLGIVHQSDWQLMVAEPMSKISDCWLAEEIASLGELLFSDHHYEQKEAIGCLVNAFITAIGLERQGCFDEPLLDWQACLAPPMAQALDILKRFVLNYVIQTPQIEIVRFKGQQIVMELYQAFASDPERLLPLNTRSRWKIAAESNCQSRVISDYIAGMTDDYAQRLYQKMF